MQAGEVVVHHELVGAGDKSVQRRQRVVVAPGSVAAGDIENFALCTVHHDEIAAFVDEGRVGGDFGRDVFRRMVGVQDDHDCSGALRPGSYLADDCRIDRAALEKIDSVGDVALSVLIDSPFNDPVVSRAAVAAILDAGFGVAVMREISAQEATVTVVAGDSEVAEALSALLAGTLGELETREWAAKVTGVDAAITLGTSFADLVRNGGK